MTRIKCVLILLLIIIVALPHVASAQPVIEEDVLDNPVPFDGGVTLLVASALVYGLSKNYRKKKTLKPTKIPGID
jgi:hypothetical protein